MKMPNPEQMKEMALTALSKVPVGDVVRTAGFASGVVMVVRGVALYSVPAGWIVAGLAVAAYCWVAQPRGGIKR